MVGVIGEHLMASVEWRERRLKSSAYMPVDWQSSPQHDACLSMPVVAGEKRGGYTTVDCICKTKNIPYPNILCYYISLFLSGYTPLHIQVYYTYIFLTICKLTSNIPKHTIPKYTYLQYSDIEGYISI